METPHKKEFQSLIFSTIGVLGEVQIALEFSKVLAHLQSMEPVKWAKSQQQSQPVPMICGAIATPIVRELSQPVLALSILIGSLPTSSYDSSTLAYICRYIYIAASTIMHICCVLQIHCHRRISSEAQVLIESNHKGKTFTTEVHSWIQLLQTMRGDQTKSDGFFQCVIPFIALPVPHYIYI